MTYADKIRSMDDEELRDLIYEIIKYTKYDECDNKFKENLLKLLQEESGEDENGN